MAAEHRVYARTNLRVPVFILPTGSVLPIRAETEDVGIDGFSCYTEHLFSVGDHLQFMLFLPPVGTGADATSGVCVHGEAEIDRVTLGPVLTSYGVGCRLTSYRVLSDFDILTEKVRASILQSSD